ncbi:uncharacterized protein LOC109801147 [Cajanus cajan]|uniref:uncharacterized protein LOC109801147 n=1 Tax=Cajanus cajan TaxID=3821 RepID=UPI00098DC8D2|nr:uncharacterized protein LOC109801147 [Cajanus cajan]
MKEGNYRQADCGGRARVKWTHNNDEEKFTPLNVPRRTHGHSTENCFVLGRQIERLIKEGRLKKFVARKQEEGSSDRRHRRAQDETRRDRHRERTPPKDTPARSLEAHQQPIHGDFNTIAGGFAGGRATSAARKRYTCSVLKVSKFRRPSQPEISFSDSDYEGVAPHEDDPVVVSAIVMRYNVKRVLVDQGSSADILFWEAFEGMKIPNDRLIPYAGTLVGFAGDQVIARGYADLETTFGHGAQMKTVVVRYLVVNAQSSYNILIGRPTLNKLGAGLSTSHLKVKYPLPNGAVGVLRVDQEVARKC